MVDDGKAALAIVGVLVSMLDRRGLVAAGQLEAAMRMLAARQDSDEMRETYQAAADLILGLSTPRPPDR